MSTFVPDHLELKESSNGGRGIFVRKYIKKDQMIFSLVKDVVLLPNLDAGDKAIQIDEDLYLDPKLHFWQFWNHSCDPNTMLDTEKFQIVAIRDIAVGEEITYHYCTTEFDLLAKNEHFQCRCGSENCIGIISGFKHISQELKTTLKPYLANYLKKNFSIKTDLHYNV